MGSSQTVIPPPPDGFKLVDSGPPPPPAGFKLIQPEQPQQVPPPPPAGFKLIQPEQPQQVPPPPPAGFKLIQPEQPQQVPPPPPAGFKLIQPEQPQQVPPPPPGFNLLDVAPAPVAPQSKPSAPITGPTYNAPAKLPWYHELLNRIENVVAGPGAALNDTLGKLLNTAQPTQATWQPPTEKPILDLSALKAEQAVPGSGPASQVARGAVEGAEGFGSGLTTPMNAALIAGTAGFGEALPVVSKLLSGGFSLQMLRSAFDQSPEFAKRVKAGDYEGAAKTLTQIGLTAAAGTLSAKHAASPEGIAPIAADNVSRETAQRMAGNEGVTPEEVARDAVGNTPGPYAQRYPENAPPPPPLGFKIEQNPPSPRKTAPRPTVPEEGSSDAEQRLADARDRLAQSISGQPYEKLEPRDQTAIDDLARQGYGHSVQPGAAQPEPTTQNAPSFEGEKQEVETPAAETPAEENPPRTPQKPVAYGAATKIRIPGENRSYDAVYTVRDESDVYPSHNPFNFEPNPDYEHVNDRSYAEPRNAERVVKQEAEFDPGFLVNDNPDATNGPPIWDARGNVLGGNSREMTIERVNENRPDAAQAYRDLQVKQATRFGIPPKLIERMGRPVLGREVIGDINPQQAITDFNKTGTAALTQAERAISDSKRLSPDTADFLARRIDEEGPDGTLAQALEGTGGRDIVNRLVDDGVITTQEKPQLLNGDGSMTPEGKQRVGRLLSGQFFSSARELEETPPELRAKLDRIVPSVMRTAQRPEWDIAEPVKEAVSLVRDAKAHGITVDDAVRQGGLFGAGERSDEAIAIARTLEKKPTQIARAFRQYASDEALSRPGAPMTMGFEPPDREEAFESAFGKAEESKTPETMFAQAHGPATQQRQASPTRTAPKPGQTAVVPSAGARVANRWATFKDAILRLIAPAARTEGARETSYVMREMGGKLANRLEQAHEALKDGRKYFAARQPAENNDFIDRMESGRTQRTLAEQAIANTMRQMMDQARDAVQALGTGKLQNFYENYFPHIWEKPAAARDFFTQFIQKRPLQGSRAFTKQRSLVTFKDGLDAGFKPVSDNPVDLVLAKMHEMNKYVLAHEAMAEMKDRGMVEYFKATQQPPVGYKRIEDSIATVFGKPNVTVHESYDKPLMTKLNDFASSLGISHDRLTRLSEGPRNAQGFAKPSGEIETKFASPEQVLIHEIGHILEHRYKLSNALKGPGIPTELNDLAALRWEGENPSAAYKAYARTGDEKMANAIAAMIHIPERFQQIAPKTWDLLRDEIYSHPELRPLLDIQKSMTLGSNTDEVPVGGMVIRGHYWAREDRAAIVNNYLSPGLRGNPIYDWYMGIGNSLNQFQLGLSAFHFGTTAMEAMISNDALALRKMTTGDPVAPAKAAFGSIVAPFRYYSEGSKVLQAMRKPGSMGADLAQIADSVVKAGGRSRMDKFYDTGMGERMVDAFRRGDIAKGIGLSVPGLADLSSHFLIKEWVPRLKLGAFSDIAKYELGRLGPEATPKDAQAALSRAWDSIDNRFGQVVYDNLFWNKTFKDLAMASVRAVGWNLGSLREGLGGIADTAANAKKAASGDHTAEVTNRMAYIPAMIFRTGMMGAATYYLMTGKAPQRLKDYFFPGGHSMPGFLKDAVNWSTYPVDTAKGKLHPAATLIWDMLNNRDFFDKPIAKHGDPLLKKAADYAKFVAEQYEPLSIRDAIKGKNPLGTDPYQFFGMPKEPRAVRDAKK